MNLTKATEKRIYLLGILKKHWHYLKTSLHLGKKIIERFSLHRIIIVRITVF